MTTMEQDLGNIDYCSRCLKDIHISDFKDKNELDVYKIWGFCSDCQKILTEDRQ